MLAAAVIYAASLAWTAINPDPALSATIIGARVAPVPPQFVERLVDGGCDALVANEEFRSFEARDARLASPLGVAVALM